MATATNHQPGTKNIGHVTQVIGSTFDVEFAEGQLPAIYNAVRIDSQHKGVTLNLTGEVQQHLGGGRVRCVALGSTDGMIRGQECIDTGEPVTVPVGKATLGRVFNLIGEPIDGRGPVNADEYGSIHRDAPALDRPVDQDRAVRDGHQGDRPAHAVRPRWQGRAVRRRRSGQDGYSHRADRPHRQCPRRLLGVRRRRRANPRRNRPVAGNAGSQDRRHRPQRYRANLHGVRPDERAAGSPSARGPVGLDDGRILPRHDRRRHAAVRRQHFPLLAGRQRSLRAVGTYAFGRGLPADAGHGNGRPAGTHRLDQEGGHHLGAGRVRAGRRSDRSGPGHGLRPAGRVSLSGTFDHRKRHLPGGRSAGFVQPDSRSAVRGRAALRDRPPRADARCSAIANCKTSSRFWASTN